MRSAEQIRFLEGEYSRLWQDYGLDAISAPPAVDQAVPSPLIEPRPTPEGPSPFLVCVETPPEPSVGFVVQLSLEYPRLKKDEEALWERMLQALSLNRDAVALIKILALPGQPQTAATNHFLWALPPSLRWIIFFGNLPFQTVTHGAGTQGIWAPLPDSAAGQWLLTHDLAKLTRDPNSKKETWNHLKDLPQRLK